MSERCSHDDFRLFHPLRVRWAEVDAQGIVFNPHYFAWADIAMTEYMRAAGFPYPNGFLQHGADLFAVRSEADYFASALYDDLLELAARVEYIGRTSLRFLTGIYRDTQLLTQLRITYVNAAPADKRPAALPGTIVDKILAYERTPPLRKQ